MSIPSSAEQSAAQQSAAATFRPGLFDGQHVLVTGGTSGIGAATVALFHALGASVTAVGLDARVPAEADERLATVDLDVTDAGALEGAIGRLPRLDHLVLCAGISLNAAELETEGFRRVLDVNLVHCMTASMAAAPLLARHRGSIVTIASMYAFFAGAERPAYAASKGGIVQLTKALAQLLAPRGVRANAIAPGWIETPLARNLDSGQRARILERIPANRWGESDEVAAVIAFLCSPAAAYITGAVLPVDGGYLIA